MCRYKGIGSVVAFALLIYCLWLAFRPAKIIRVDDNAVFVEYLPITTQGKVHWWLKNKAILQKKYHLLTASNNTSAVIMNFGGYKNLPTGTRDGSVDDYTCFDEHSVGDKKCIYNDMAMFVIVNADGHIFINVGDSTYLQTADNSAILQKKSGLSF